MNESIHNLIQKVIDWGHARNLINGATAVSQMNKLTSEFGEMCEELEKGESEALLWDGIGDTFIVGIIVSTQMGLMASEVYAKADLSQHSGVGTYETALRAAGLVGKMADNVLKTQPQEFSDNLARLIALLDCIAYDTGTDLATCLAGSYGEIKDRKGVMYNGAFIKDSDPRYSGILAELGITEG